MKQFFTFIAVLFCISQLAGQTTMKIYQNNGTVLQIPLSSIDSIIYNIAGVSSVSTTAITNISAFTAESGGDIPNGSTVTTRGVCWGTISNPTIAGSKTTDGSGTGNFTSTLSGLSSSTTYYVRAYATNSAGTAYGGEITFTTSAPPFSILVSDFDGNGVGTWKNNFFSYLSTPSSSDSANNTNDPSPGAYSGSKYWKVSGSLLAANPYYLDGFGTKGAGAFNFDAKDSIVFYANSLNNSDTRITVNLTDQKQINGYGETFIYQLNLIPSNSWIRYAVGINQLISDPYNPNNSSAGMTHVYYPSLAAVDDLGFSVGSATGTVPTVEANIDDIQIIRVP